MENNCDLTIARLAPLIRRKKISPVEVTRFLLDRIFTLQPVINAYLTVTADLALAQARKEEREISRGNYKGALHGIPISLKDLFHTRGIRTTAGSRVLKDFVPKDNAAAVDRLLDSGCIILGKTNLHEFAYGITNVNPHFGAVRNPWNPGRISGGSSGGSAASVVSAQAIASLGTDTGGSIRIPAAACGCVGLKPTFGRVPLQGVIPLSSSLDHAGALGRCVSDVALIYEHMSGAGRSLSTSKLRQGAKNLTIGVPRQYFFDRIQADVRRAVLTAISDFERLGAAVREIDLEGMEETAPLASDITAAEALAYHDKWLKRKAAGYGRDVRSRLELSRSLTALQYLQAQGKRAAYTERLARTLASVTVLACPTLPVVAPELNRDVVVIGRARREVREALLSLTRPANLSGLPAISIPCGFSIDGLPIGLQLIGRRYDEETLLCAAYIYESATSWHRQFPPDPVGIEEAGTMRKTDLLWEKRPFSDGRGSER
jgi:aspartyl-tRNA(Asn)/glutamyl-tRNA(Gln) amidotransferase subunit A